MLIYPIKFFNGLEHLKYSYLVNFISAAIVVAERIVLHKYHLQNSTLEVSSPNGQENGHGQFKQTQAVVIEPCVHGGPFLPEP